MSQGLFIGTYLDEDEDVLVSELLKSRGFRAITARDAGQLGKSDSDQLAYAAEAGLTLLTHNRADFEELHRQYLADGRSHAGVIIAVRRSPYEIAERLLQLLDAVTADEIQNQLLYI